MAKQEDIEQMLLDLEARESKLSDWERGFVDQLNKQLARGSGISKKQEDKLDEIWERLT